MNLRLTVTAALAVILASVSVYPLIQTAAWFWAGVGAVIAAAVAGALTRLPTLHAAVAGSVLALLAVCPLLFAPEWGLKVVGVAIIGITAAGRPRLRLLHALAIVTTYLSALLIYLNVTFAAHLSTAAFVPTRASLSYLSTLVSQGMSERIYEPPVPSNPGVILLAAGGIGLMAAATDLLAVRLRSPAIAGLPLLALYCVRITTSARQGSVGATVVFGLTLIGYLALLAADGRERLRIWGRLVTVWHGASGEPSEPSEPSEAAEASRQATPVVTVDVGEAPDTRALAASGRRIGLAAACIALVFPLLLPGISVHDLFHAAPTATGSGGPLIAPPNPLVQMRDQLLATAPQTVLTYQTTAKNPRQQYLQVYVLNFDAGKGNWTLVQPGGPSTSLTSSHLASVPGVAAGTPQTETNTRITLSQRTTGYDSKLGFLPLPYAPTQVQAPGSWQEDDATLMVYSGQPHLSGLMYSVTSRAAFPDSADENKGALYPPSIAGNYLSFPKGPRDELARLATQITARDRTPYAKALALQRYFQSGSFTYSVYVSLPNGINGLTQFLFQTKTGFCQQFAFAMAGLARLVGIPSRIAVGYTAGTPKGHGVWKVTSADAHAWPELYFRDLGWIRFEPTPGGAEGTATVPQYSAPPGLGIVPTSPATGKVPSSKTGANGTNPNLAHIHDLAGGESGGGSRATADHGISPLIPLIVAAVVVVALIFPASARSVVRRRRLQTSGDAKLAHAVWREVRDDLADHGLGGRPSESPRATAARVAALAGLGPQADEALTRIVRAEERARYATSPLASSTLRSDSAEVRRALSRQATWVERWRARMLPASVLAPVRTGLQHALDIFGWMEAAGARFRGRGFGNGTLGSGVSHQE
jgi:transglutaminase-like putative cysteine protease